MKVLIQYKTSSKVREIADGQQLIDVIESTFEISRNYFSLQKYDADFNEYVDYEYPSSLEEKTKIRVVDSSPNIDYNYTVEHIDETAVSSHLEDINPEVILNLKPQWPLGIKLPIEDFSRQLLEALEKEKNLTWVQSSELVSHLANYAYKYKKYPNKQERLQICEELVNRFPYLKSEIGLGVGGWEIKLLNKLKKIRQSDPSLETELNRMKRKASSGIVPKRMKLNPEKGEVNWAPDHIEGEDELSQTTHRQIMIEESKKSISFQNKIKTKSLMALTFSFRRNSINNNSTIQYLKEQYPLFFQEEEQYDELQRLTAVDIKESFKEVKAYSFQLLELFREKNSDSLKDIKIKIEAILQSSEDENMKSSLGLYLLPYLLKEPVECFVEE
ncbi:hypothetical protein AVEN_133465-1, partial [Araneus ventricosus]